MSDPNVPRPMRTLWQRHVYDFLRDQILNRDYGPTDREICAHCNIKFLPVAQAHLKALEKKGFIERMLCRKASGGGMGGKYFGTVGRNRLA